jgi:hypothetical protein
MSRIKITLFDEINSLEDPFIDEAYFLQRQKEEWEWEEYLYLQHKQKQNKK